MSANLENSAVAKGLKKARFHFNPKDGHIKHRNRMDLTEAEDIRKRWQQYTEELYKKKDHHGQISMMV